MFNLDKENCFCRVEHDIIFKTISIDGKVSLTVNNIRVFLAINLDLSQMKFGKLSYFDIDENYITISNLDLNIRNCGGFCGFLGSFTNIMSGLFKSQIVSAIEGPIRKQINDYIAGKSATDLGINIGG